MVKSVKEIELKWSNVTHKLALVSIAPACKQQCILVMQSACIAYEVCKIMVQKIIAVFLHNYLGVHYSLLLLF